MLQRLKETNLRATGVEGFLFDQAGPLGNLDKSKTQTLDSLIDKKRIFESKKVLMSGQPIQISQVKLTTEEIHKLTYKLGKESLVVSYKVSQNQFTKMPKGRLRIKVANIS